MAILIQSSAVLMNNAAAMRTQFTNGILEGWSGSLDQDPAAPMSGTKLIVFTLNAGVFVPGAPGNGLTLDAPVLESGIAYLRKPTAQLWQGLVLALGTVNSIVYRANPVDANAISDTHARIKMDVSGETGTGTAKLSKLTYTVIGEPVDVSSMQLAFGN